MKPRFKVPQTGAMDARGMTLVELMVGLAMFGIILAASLPGFRAMLDGNRHNAAIQQLTSRMFLTRQMSVRDRQNYVMTLDLVNQRYSVFRDTDGDGVQDAGETALGPWAMRDGVRLQNVNWGGNAMTFFPNGSTNQTADLRIIDVKGRSRTIRCSSITGDVQVLP